MSQEHSLCGTDCETCEEDRRELKAAHEEIERLKKDLETAKPYLDALEHCKRFRDQMGEAMNVNDLRDFPFVTQLLEKEEAKNNRLTQALDEAIELLERDQPEGGRTDTFIKKARVIIKAKAILGKSK